MIIINLKIKVTVEETDAIQEELKSLWQHTTTDRKRRRIVSTAKGSIFVEVIFHF